MITNENKFINDSASVIEVLNNGVYVAFCILKFKFGFESFTEKSYKIVYGNSYRTLYPSKAYDVDFTAYCYTSCSDYKVICHRQSQVSLTSKLILEGTVFNPSCRDYRSQNYNYCECKCYEIR